MKQDIHPQYKEVLYIDSSSGDQWVCLSTFQTGERETYEGKEYPVCRLAISGYSHPAYTGAQQFVDTEGRIDKFRKRYERKKPAAAPPAAVEEAPKKKRGKKA